MTCQNARPLARIISKGARDQAVSLLTRGND